jgi:hypothetical protein
LSGLLPALPGISRICCNALLGAVFVGIVLLVLALTALLSLLGGASFCR